MTELESMVKQAALEHAGGMIMSEKIKYVSDHADLQHWINCYADISRCAGDRIIHMGYFCLHCGSANPFEDCGAPKPAAELKRTGEQQ